VAQVIRAPATRTFSLVILQMMSHEIFAQGAFHCDLPTHIVIVTTENGPKCVFA
jgi:hypothetical protein